MKCIFYSCISFYFSTVLELLKKKNSFGYFLVNTYLYKKYLVGKKIVEVLLLFALLVLHAGLGGCSEGGG